MRVKHIFLILILVILVLGCNAKTAKNGDNVAVLYSVYGEDGVLIDNNNNNPLEFTIGSGEVIKGFNYAVLGMRVGESKEVTVLPKEGYGDYYAYKNVIEDIENLRAAGVEPEKGGIIYSTINGNRERGEITDLNGTHAMIDFNHPLAGKTLTFKIKLVDINTHAGSAI